MHAPLDRPHPDCGAFIEALKACHTGNPYAKFWGECNEAKALMDRCLRAEKERARSENLRQAREFDRKFEAYIHGTSNKESEEKK
jgi:COX assembly protein 2